MDLQECRTKLDEIDRQIVKLFEEPMEIIIRQPYRSCLLRL